VEIAPQPRDGLYCQPAGGGMSWQVGTAMPKQMKTAPELERYILMELRNCAGCNAVAAVTVGAIDYDASTNWEVTHLHVPGGVVPKVCQDICASAVEKFRAQYDLVTEIEPEEL
jgi:hypothetical protein